MRQDFLRGFCLLRFTPFNGNAYESQLSEFLKCGLISRKTVMEKQRIKKADE